MKIFLFVLIFTDGGSRVFYERQYNMPDIETCMKAVENSKSNVHVSTGGKSNKKAGTVLYCASERVETP